MLKLARLSRLLALTIASDASTSRGGFSSDYSIALSLARHTVDGLLYIQFFKVLAIVLYAFRVTNVSCDMRIGGRHFDNRFSVFAGCLYVLESDGHRRDIRAIL